MDKYSVSEHLLIEEVTLACQKLKNVLRGFSIGPLIKAIRVQLGMSQRALAKRAKVPQPTISRIEKGGKDPNLSTLRKILGALSCDLVIAPLLKDSIHEIRRKQARKLAAKQISYLKGTMNLEDQKPDPRFIEELLKHEENRLLHDPNSKLWND